MGGMAENDVARKLRAIEKKYENKGAFTGEVVIYMMARDAAGEIERLEAEVERLRARWEETASDNTDYHLSHSDGIYTVSDQNGHVVCEFIRAAEEAARAALEGGQNEGV